MARACFQKSLRAEVVHEVIVAGVLCFGQSGAVEYERNALDSGGERFGLGAVALCELHIQPLKPARMPEIPHQAGYGITVPEEPFDQMTSDKAGSARDQYPS
jgi:hypothetical protein